MGCEGVPASCAGGAGTCAENGSICVCLDSQMEDAGDFWSSTDCKVNSAVNAVVWIVNGSIWSLCLVLSVVAILSMKRKNASAQRFDMFSAAVCFLACMCGVVVAVLEAGYGRRLAVDVGVTVMFSLHHFFSWLMLIVKPIAKSEYSISGFAASRNFAIVQKYKQVFPFLLFVVSIAGIFPIVAATHHHLQRSMQIVFFTCVTIAMTIMGVTALAAARRASNEFNRTLANPAITRRSSMSLRVQSFFRHARRVMLLAVVIILVLIVILLVFIACEPCSRYCWILIPVAMSVCGLWFCRNMAVSTYVSRKNRQHTATSLHSHNNQGVDNGKDQVHSSKEVTVLSGDGSPATGTTGTAQKLSSSSSSLSQTRSRSSSRSRTRTGKKKKLLVNRAKKMSAVQEADYEGTVVMTQVDGLTRYNPSKVSVHDARGMEEEDIPEESADGTS